MNFADRIRAELQRAALSIGAPEAIEQRIERPRDPLLADWASNVAMVLARPLRRKPAEIAISIRDAINLADAGVDRIEIAGPGFLNFRLDP
ncbi:MAG: arginine--tRNA ligase, partial [Gemmatimonadales bacterium]